MDRRKFICETLKFIDENFSNKMVLDELAKTSGYSIPQFSRLFVEFTGITPMRYVNVVRIQNSTTKRKLVDTFVNSVYLYDDKVVIIFNCREGASTLALPLDDTSACMRIGEPT